MPHLAALRSSAARLSCSSAISRYIRRMNARRAFSAGSEVWSMAKIFALASLSTPHNKVSEA